MIAANAHGSRETQPLVQKRGSRWIPNNLCYSWGWKESFRFLADIHMEMTPVALVWSPGVSFKLNSPRPVFCPPKAQVPLAGEEGEAQRWLYGTWTFLTVVLMPLLIHRSLLACLLQAYIPPSHILAKIRSAYGYSFCSVPWLSQSNIFDFFSSVSHHCSGTRDVPVSLTTPAPVLASWQWHYQQRGVQPCECTLHACLQVWREKIGRSL